MIRTCAAAPDGMCQPTAAASLVTFPSRLTSAEIKSNRSPPSGSDLIVYTAVSNATAWLPADTVIVLPLASPVSVRKSDSGVVTRSRHPGSRSRKSGTVTCVPDAGSGTCGAIGGGAGNEPVRREQAAPAAATAARNQRLFITQRYHRIHVCGPPRRNHTCRKPRYDDH